MDAFVNGHLHLGRALAMRRAKPGLRTGALVLLPLGAADLGVTSPLASIAQQLISIAAVGVLHAVILLRVARPLRST